MCLPDVDPERMNGRGVSFALGSKWQAPDLASYANTPLVFEFLGRARPVVERQRRRETSVQKKQNVPDFPSGVALVLGGARSGKSVFAEHVCNAVGRQKIYLATSQALDGEMEERIAQHQERRGVDWRLVEEPLDLLGALQAHASLETCILVDCLTLWLTNLMMAERDVVAECAALVEGISTLPKESSIIFVSNEVGQGIVPMEKMARDFRDHAGRLHQNLAEHCDRVWFVTAGLANQLK